MTRERKFIGQLERDTGVTLSERTFEKLDQWKARSFAIGKNGEVVGLNLDVMKLGRVPVSLSKFLHLKKL